jgi:hypothetical protein
MIATTDPITAARAAALFVSDISATGRPTRAEAEEAIGRAIHAHNGIRGCVADMAATYGDYPELAAARMAWARGVAEGLRHHAVVSHVDRRAPRALAPLAAAA